MASYGEQKLHDLVRRLAFSTERGSTEWESTDRDFAFRATLGDTSIIVASQDDDGTAPWTLQIIDSSGDVVDSLTTWSRAVRNADGRTVRQGAAWNTDLHNLYEMARRNALNIEAIVNDLLSQLPEPPSDEPPF